MISLIIGNVSVSPPANPYPAGIGSSTDPGRPASPASPYAPPLPPAPSAAHPVGAAPIPFPGVAPVVAFPFPPPATPTDASGMISYT